MTEISLENLCQLQFSIGWLQGFLQYGGNHENALKELLNIKNIIEEAYKK